MDNQLFEQLAKASPVPQAVLNQKGTVVVANEALCTMIGAHRNMIVGHAWKRWLDVKSRGFFGSNLSERLTGGRWTGELALVNLKGERRQVELTLFPMGGRHYGLMLRSIEEEIARDTRYLDRIDAIEKEHQAVLEGIRKGYIQNQLTRSRSFAKSLSLAMAHPLAYLRSDLETIEAYYKKVVTLQQAYELLIKDLRFDEQPHLLPRLNVVKSLRRRYDLDFLREDIKKVLAEAETGLGQLRQINQALNQLRSDDEVDGEGASLSAAMTSALLLLSGSYVSDFTVHDSGVKELPAVAMSSDRVTLVFLEIFAVSLDSLESRLSPEEGEIRIDGRVRGGEIYLSIQDSGRGMSVASAEELFPSREAPGEALKRSYAIPMALIREAGGDLEISGGHQNGRRVILTLPVEKGNPPV